MLRSSYIIQVSDVNHGGKAQQPIQTSELRVSTEDEANGAKHLVTYRWRGPWGTTQDHAQCGEITIVY